jgi:hypothetical protein
VDYEIHYPEPTVSWYLDFAEKHRGGKPLKRILQLVQLHDCQTILVENNYECFGFKAEHEAHYKKLFKSYPRAATRLHFFSAKIEQKDLSSLKEFNGSYIGFSVLRPLPSQRVIFSIIRPLKDQNSPPKSFFLSKHVYAVNLNGNSLTVEGFPFMQQDGRLDSCAHVAISSALNHFPLKDGGKLPSIGDIVEAAAQVPHTARGIPTEGLSVPQICHVLRKFDRSPLVYEFGKDMPAPYTAERVIYHYLESGIPVIIGIKTAGSGHALVVVGHSFEPDTWWALAGTDYYQGKPSGIKYHCSTTWIQNFIIQDDNYGPYLTIPRDYVWAMADQSLVVIVPLPKDVMVKGEDAEYYAYRMLSDKIILRRFPKEGDTRFVDIFVRHLETDQLVLRTYLQERNEFKQKVKDDKDLSPQLSRFYQDLAMPEHIWITEVSIPELFCQQRLCFGEVITDSTTDLKMEHGFLSIHLPRLLVIRDINADDKPYEFCSLDKDQPRMHLIR